MAPAARVRNLGKARCVDDDAPNRDRPVFHRVPLVVRASKLACLAVITIVATPRQRCGRLRRVAGDRALRLVRAPGIKRVEYSTVAGLGPLHNGFAAMTSSRPPGSEGHRVQYNSPMPHADRARVIAPPPLIYVAVFAVGCALDRCYPVSLRPDHSAGWLGWAIFAAGLGVLALSGAYLNRAGTPVNPYRPSTTLVTAGPYRYSRNPLYVALTLAYLGVAVVMNTVWPVMLLPGLLLLMRWGVISREERYLERRFGDEYRRYQARVRRWL